MVKVPPEEGLERQERRDTLDGWPIRLTTYRTGDRFICKIDNIDPGTLMARGEGRTRQDAERAAVTMAIARATNTKRMQATMSELRLRVAELDKRLSDAPPTATSGPNRPQRRRSRKSAEGDGATGAEAAGSAGRVFTSVTSSFVAGRNGARVGRPF